MTVSYSNAASLCEMCIILQTPKVIDKNIASPFKRGEDKWGKTVVSWEHALSILLKMHNQMLVTKVTF